MLCPLIVPVISAEPVLQIVAGLPALAGGKAIVYTICPVTEPLLWVRNPLKQRGTAIWFASGTQLGVASPTDEPSVMILNCQLPAIRLSLCIEAVFEQDDSRRLAASSKYKVENLRRNTVFSDSAVRNWQLIK